MFQNPMKYHSELSKNLVIFSEASFLKISMNAWTKVFFQYEPICAKIVPLYKKINKKDKHNYRPVSILPNIYQNYMKVICINKSMNI